MPIRTVTNPFELYLPCGSEPRAWPNFFSAPLQDPAWEKQTAWARSLGYKGIALDLRGNPPWAPALISHFEGLGFEVVEIRSTLPENPGERRWIGFSENLGFLADAIDSPDCLEAIWAPESNEVFSAQQSTANRLAEHPKFAVFMGSLSSKVYGALLRRQWRAPLWIDGWKKSPQALWVHGYQIAVDQRGHQTPEWSFIVPSHRHDNELKHTISALARLRARAPFEVIVLDDNESAAVVTDSALPKDFSCLWVHVPRAAGREFGDRQFRAASIRNLGVRLSRGKQLVFLDSDILLREDFLERMAECARENALMQPCRWNLRETTSLEGRSVSDLSPHFDCMLSFRGAWEDAQYNGDWTKRAHPWQWISTFCLSVPRHLFCEAGGFRESFDRYGFEDTELGLRLVRSGAELIRVPTEVFHQFHLKERSEYDGSAEQRRKLRALSFENFFRWVLDPEIYREFSGK